MEGSIYEIPCLETDYFCWMKGVDLGKNNGDRQPAAGILGLCTRKHLRPGFISGPQIIFLAKRSPLVVGSKEYDAVCNGKCNFLFHLSSLASRTTLQLSEWCRWPPSAVSDFLMNLPQKLSWLIKQLYLITASFSAENWSRPLKNWVNRVRRFSTDSGHKQKLRIHRVISSSIWFSSWDHHCPPNSNESLKQAPTPMVIFRHPTHTPEIKYLS